jgi:hypothetical protein
MRILWTISTKFLTKTRQNFLWSIRLMQDDRMMQLFSRVRSRGGKIIFLSTFMFSNWKATSLPIYPLSWCNPCAECSL